MIKSNFKCKIYIVIIVSLLIGIGIIPQTIGLRIETDDSINKLELLTISYNIDTIIEVEVIEGIQAVIKNVGEVDAINVEWEIWLDGPFFFFSPGKQTGTIDLLETGREEVIKYQTEFLFGLGALNQMVKGKAENSNEDTDKERIGFLLGIFFLPFPI